MKKTSTALSALAIGLTMSIVAPSAMAADKCKHETCWGAVGFGPSKKIGYSYWYSTEDKAIARVKKECPTCQVIESFANGCGALTEASNGAWGFAKGSNKDEATAGALAICGSKGGSDCARRVWGCSRK